MKKTANDNRLSWLHKHRMIEDDFEIEYAQDATYHEVIPHFHEFFELLFFVAGHVDYIVADERFHLTKGDLLIIPPDTVHGPVFLDFEESYERFVLWVATRTLERLILQDPDLGYFRKKKPMYLYHSQTATWNSMKGSFLTLYNAYINHSTCYKSEGLSVIMHVMSQYNRAIAVQNGAAQDGLHDTLLSDILNYVQNNLSKDLSLDTVAAIFYTSKSNISHIFKKEMRISYYQYVIELRLIEGKNRLLDGMPVYKVWESCGFSDHTAFYRAFRKWYGISPSEFKKSCTKPALMP